MEGPDRSRKMNNEHKNGPDGMEEIPLEDTDRTSVEFRVLMAYAQRRLSASKYGQLLERGPRVQEERSGVVQVNTLAEEEEEVTFPEISPEDHKPPSQKDQKKVKKKKKAKKAKTRTNWKCFCIPSCLRGTEVAHPGIQRECLKQDSVNGHGKKLFSRIEGLSDDLDIPPLAERLVEIVDCSGFPEQMKYTMEVERVLMPPIPPAGDDGLDDSDIPRLAERLVEIVDRSRFPVRMQSAVEMERTLNLEEDGGSASKPIPPAGDDGLDNEEKVIDAIVALLRKSGDELEERMKKDKSFCQYIWDMMPSYNFFRRVTDRFLEETPMYSTVGSEDEVQRIKLALIMEATTKLTVLDNHPMNLVLGFGSKYLQENFSPWIQSHGGLMKALGLPDQEEVE